MAFCQSSPCGRPPPTTSAQPARRPADLNAGDICEVRASLKHAYLKVLLDHKTTAGSTHLTWQNQHQLKRLESGEVSDDLKNRPCLIYSARPEGKDTIPGAHWTPQICLMGSFGDAEHEALSRFYKFFAIPVHPTSGAATAHLHTIPEWVLRDTTSKQYIIAYRFALPAQSVLTDRWVSHPSDGEATTFHLDAATLKDWIKLCDVKMAIFQSKGPSWIKSGGSDVHRRMRDGEASSIKSHASVLSRKSMNHVDRFQSLGSKPSAETWTKSSGSSQRATASRVPAWGSKIPSSVVSPSLLRGENVAPPPLTEP